MRRRFINLVAAAVGMAPIAALAHAFLSQALPPVDGTVASSPKEIRLTFSEGVEPRFSGIELATSDGRAIATAPATPDPETPSSSFWSCRRSLPGRYKVSWHVVSVDTHRTEGAYSFAVAP